MDMDLSSTYSGSGYSLCSSGIHSERSATVAETATSKAHKKRAWYTYEPVSSDNEDGPSTVSISTELEDAGRMRRSLGDVHELELELGGLGTTRTVRASGSGSGSGANETASSNAWRPKRKRTKTAKLAGDISDDAFEQLVASVPVITVAPESSTVSPPHPAKAVRKTGHRQVKFESTSTPNRDHETYFWYSGIARLFPCEARFDKLAQRSEILEFPPGSYLGPLKPDHRPIGPFIFQQHCVPNCSFKIRNKRLADAKEHLASCSNRRELFSSTGKPDVLGRLCELVRKSDRRGKRKPPDKTQNEPEIQASDQQQEAFLDLLDTNLSSHCDPFREPKQPEPIFLWVPPTEATSTGTELGPFACSFCGQVATDRMLVADASCEYNVSIRKHIVQCRKIGDARSPVLRLWDEGKDLGDGALRRPTTERRVEPTTTIARKPWSDVNKTHQGAVERDDHTSSAFGPAAPTSRSMQSELATRSSRDTRTNTNEESKIANNKKDRRTKSASSPTKPKPTTDISDTRSNETETETRTRSNTTNNTTEETTIVVVPRIVHDVLAPLPPPDDTSDTFDVGSTKPVDDEDHENKRTSGGRTKSDESKDPRTTTRSGLQLTETTPMPVQRKRETRRKLRRRRAAAQQEKRRDRTCPFIVTIQGDTAIHLRVTCIEPNSEEADAVPVLLRPVAITHFAPSNSAPVSIHLFNIPGYLVRARAFLGVELESDILAVPSESKIELRRGRISLRVEDGGVTWEIVRRLKSSSSSSSV